MPDDFWSLTVREFHLKHAAFQRAEDRARSLVFELASMLGNFKDKDRRKVVQAANKLRRYPVKAWLTSR